MANAANLRQLAERALTVMDVLQAYAEQLRGLQRRRRQDGDRGDGCRKIVSRFQDHLRVGRQRGRAVGGIKPCAHNQSNSFNSLEILETCEPSTPTACLA